MIIIPISQMRKMRHREVKWLVPKVGIAEIEPSHLASLFFTSFLCSSTRSEPRSQDLNLGEEEM